MALRYLKYRTDHLGYARCVAFVILVIFIGQSSGEVRKVCPTQPITFNCTVTDTAGGALSTRWRGDSRVFDCPMDGDIIILPHSGSGTLNPVSCGAATGQRQPADGNNYTSVLTVVPTLEMNGTNFIVQCAFPLETDIVMNYSATVVGPPDFPLTLNVSDIMPVSGVQWEFNLEWEVPPEYCDLDYIFTPLPPVGLCTTTCPTECRVFRVGPGPQNFTVTAQNCGGTQNGTESEPLLVCFERLGAPGNVSATATYDLDSNGVLSSLVLSWDEVIPKPIAAGVNESISSYVIFGVGIDPSGICPNGRCSYEVDLPANGSTEYSVSVAAINVLGVGDATTAGPVFASNEYADVTTEIEGDNCTLTVQCVTQGLNEFWITLTESDTTVLPRRMIDCNASVPVVVPVEEQSMLPREFEYEIEVMIGEDINVILLGGFVGNCTVVMIDTEPDGDGSEGSSAGAIAGGAAGGGVVAGYVGGVIFNGVVAVPKRTSITLHLCVIILLCLLSWFYGFYLLCRPCCYSTSQKKPSQERSVEAAVDDEVKASEEVIDMSDAYETVPSTQPAVRTKVMGVESTQPQQGAAKSEEELKAAKKKGFFKNKSGKKADKKKSDEVELQPQEPLESAETGTETGALYQDPGEIKREEYPGTHDFYAQPDIKRKTHKPEDHLPTYGDPRDIKHVEAPETGELYAVTKQPSKKRAAPPPPEGATGYTSVDIEKKHRAKELNYSELQMPPGGPAPPSQHVEYSNVVQL